jgi:hypothetical protein
MRLALSRGRDDPSPEGRQGGRGGRQGSGGEGGASTPAGHRSAFAQLLRSPS